VRLKKLCLVLYLKSNKKQHKNAIPDTLVTVASRRVGMYVMRYFSYCLRCNYGNRIMCIVVLDCRWLCIWFTSPTVGSVALYVCMYVLLLLYIYINKKRGVAWRWRSRISKLTNFGLDWITTGYGDGPPFWPHPSQHCRPFLITTANTGRLTFVIFANGSATRRRAKGDHPAEPADAATDIYVSII